MLNLIKQKIKSQLIAEFDDYETHDKIYKSGAITLILYIFVMLVVLLVFKQHFIQKIANFFMYIIFFIFTIAVIFEYWMKIQKLYTKSWFKWLLGAITIIVYKYSELHAENFINNFTLNEPSYFPTATSALAVLFLLYSWSIAVSAFLMFFIFFNWIFIPLERNSNKRQLGGWKYIARFFGLLIILLFVQKSTKIFEDKKSNVYTLAKNVVISTEYFKYSHCGNVRSNEFSAYLDRGNISIFSPSTQKFRTEECILNKIRTKN